MKQNVRILMTVLVVSLLIAMAAFASGCSKKEPAPVDPPKVEEPAKPAETPKPAEEPDESAEGEAVLEGACIQCHDASRILVQPEMTDWVGLVNRMEQVHGAVLTAEQKDAVVKYLEDRIPSKGEEVISGKCTTCHDASRIFAQPAGTQWENVLETMIEVHKAELTEAEQKAALDYLENR